MPVSAAIALLRPLNGLITFVSVLLAAWLAAGSLPTPAFLAALTAALIASFGNGHNDLIDLEVDRRAHPARVLPSGSLRPGTAKWLAWGCALAGCALTFSLPMSCKLLAVLNTVCLWAYNRRLKWWPLFGNVLIAGIAASAFLFGGFAVGRIEGLWPITLFAFLLHLGREIVKDVEDLEGDTQSGGSTLPATWGIGTCRWLVTGLLVALIVLTPLPALLGTYGRAYLAAIGVLDALLIGTFYQLWMSRSDHRHARSSRLLKVGMFVGLGAFLVARL